jgi:uncharacterized membrane protein YeaQ/YmgE (transglycosylase-associated protein family)
LSRGLPGLGLGDKRSIMTVDFSGIIPWLVAALPIALCATGFMPGRGYGLVGDLGIGLVGALGGGYAAALLGIQGQVAWLTGLLATIVGAVMLTRLARAWPRHPAA